MKPDNPNFMAAVALLGAKERVVSAIAKLEEGLTLLTVIQVACAQRELAAAMEEMFKVEMRNPRKSIARKANDSEDPDPAG